MMVTSLKKLGLAFGVVATLATQPAMACTIVAVQELEPDPKYDIRDKCRKVWRNRSEVLADLREGNQTFSEVREVTMAFRYGRGKCRQRSDFAFEIVDAATKLPVSGRGAGSTYDLFLDWVPDNYDTTRLREIQLGTWLLGSTWIEGFCSGGSYVDSLPRIFDEHEVRSRLLSEDYWTEALGKFGGNPARDRLILRELIDPESPYFDLKRAKRLAPRFTLQDKRDLDEVVVIEVAEALADPNLGPPDYDAAAKLIWWYSPFIERGLEGDALLRMQNLWTRIQQTRLSHPDPQVARAATLALLNGDPTYRLGVPFAEILPAGAEIEVLNSWPDVLPPFRSTQRWVARIADNYPSRALRTGVAGRVDYGIIFDPQGAFHSLHITRSAGDILDRATLKMAKRYVRPRPEQLSLKGFEGRYVFIPLPSNIFRIARSKERFANDNVAADYVINIVSPVIQQHYDQ